MPRYYRRVIRIKAEDSPNVRYGLAERRKGLVPSNRILVPGVITLAEYEKRRATWGPDRQCVGLDADFYEGAEVLLFPESLLNQAEQADLALRGRPRKGVALGCDPGEGGDDTAWAVGDELGLLHLESFPTPDTAMIPNHTMGLAKRWGVPDDMIVFDRGGGGKQHADTLRANGHRVRTVNFGDSVSYEPKTENKTFAGKRELREDRSVYANRRAELYDSARIMLEGGYALPSRYQELRRQLLAMPRVYDGEGRVYLPPKNRKGENSTVKETIRDLLGRSPDQADAFVVMIYGILVKPNQRKAGALFEVH